MYDPERFVPSANLLDNIVFGKVDRRFKDVNEQIREAIAPLLMNRPELYKKIYAVGSTITSVLLDDGSVRLSTAQRQNSTSLVP
jgi:putative ABC transport system ATP-binding protein